MFRITKEICDHHINKRKQWPQEKKDLLNIVLILKLLIFKIMYS